MYNCDSHQVVLNRRALPEPPCPVAEPPSTSAVLGLVISAVAGSATRVGPRTKAGATHVSSGTSPSVPTAAAVVPRVSSRTTAMASRARRYSYVSAPTGTAGGGVSVLGGGGAASSSPSDLSDSTICHLFTTRGPRRFSSLHGWFLVSRPLSSKLLADIFRPHVITSGSMAIRPFVISIRARTTLGTARPCIHSSWPVF